MLTEVQISKGVQPEEKETPQGFYHNNRGQLLFNGHYLGKIVSEHDGDITYYSAMAGGYRKARSYDEILETALAIKKKLTSTDQPSKKGKKRK